MLEQVRKQFHLSYLALARLCGGTAAGANESAIRRLCLGTADLKQINRLKPLVERGLETFLTTRGIPADTRRDILSSIWAGPRKDEEKMNGRTVLSEQAMLHFELMRDPFRPPRSREDVYITPALRKIVSDVMDAATYQEFRAVIGPVGAGKTVVRQLLEERISEVSDGKALLVWPMATDMRDVTIRAIEYALFDALEESIPHNAVRRRTKLLKILQRERKKNVLVSICFDEAHDFTDRALLKLKDFFEMGEGFKRYLGVLMFGQPHLRTRLERDVRFREIYDRLDFSRIPGLEPDEAVNFVAHRLKVAGGNPKLIDAAVIHRLVKEHNTPLSLGNACNAAFMSALDTAVQMDERIVTVELLEAAGFFESTEPKAKARKIA